MAPSTQHKENDPNVGKLKRLSSITALASPINQFTSKFRRPSTAVPALNSGNDKTQKKQSSLPRPRQVSNKSSKSSSSKGTLKTPPPSPSSPVFMMAIWGPAPPAAVWAPKQPRKILPKSQTTSNLPVLTRREPSYARLPNSQSNTNLPRTRIPTPVSPKKADTLKTPRQPGPFAGLRKTSASAMQRSSTQPNLVAGAGLATPRRPLFRESLSGVKQDPIENKRGFSIPRKQVSTPMQKLSTTCEPVYEDGKTIVRTHTANQKPSNNWPVTPMKPTKMTWARKSIEEEYLEDLQKTPSTSKRIGAESNMLHRRSFGGEITHHQLMQPLSPPLPRLPAGYTDSNSTPTLASARLVRQVSQSQPSSYWSGRYASLNDRLLNESMNACASSPNPFYMRRGTSSEDEMSRMAGGMHGEAHAQRILDLLYAACVTEEAMSSLRRFQATFAEQRNLPNLAFYTPAAAFANLVSSERVRMLQKFQSPALLQLVSGNGGHGPAGGICSVRREMSGGSVPRSELSASTVTSGSMKELESLVGMAVSARKSSFIDRLLMGGRRISGKSAGTLGLGGESVETDRDGLLSLS